MNMLKRLLNTVNNVWNTQAKEKPLFTLRKHNGAHAMVTIEGSQLHLHSSKYHEALPYKQSIVIDELTIAELIPIIEGMGYRVEMAPNGAKYLSEGAVILMPRRDIPITDGCPITVFTSNVWRMLYPVARLLEIVEGDAELAMQQMYLRTSRSKWLDYWASFFSIKRFIQESDEALIKRIIMLLVNPKTNNRSIEELLKLMLNLDAEIHDIVGFEGNPTQKALFEVRLDAEAMTITEATDKLLMKIKAGGVYYFYNFYKAFVEDYNSYLIDKTGRPKTAIDGDGKIIADTEMLRTEDYYLDEKVIEALGFTLQYPQELYKKVADVLAVDTGFDYMEATYSAIKQLKDSWDGFHVDFIEPRYRLKRRVDPNSEDYFTLNVDEQDRLNHEDDRLLYSANWYETDGLDWSSEVSINMEAIYVKMQEEVEPFIPLYTADELFKSRVKTPIHDQLSVDIAEPLYVLKYYPPHIESTSEVSYIEQPTKAKLQETLIPIEPIYTNSETVKPYTEATDIELFFTEDPYSEIDADKVLNAFTLNVSVLNGQDLLAVTGENIRVSRIQEAVSMVMTDRRGAIIKEGNY